MQILSAGNMKNSATKIWLANSVSKGVILLLLLRIILHVHFLRTYTQIMLGN